MNDMIYSHVLNFINNCDAHYEIEKNEKHSDDTYVFKSQAKEKIDFYLSISKDLKDPRIELQLANPYSENLTDYIIVGEFYDFKEDEIKDITNIIKALLSNNVKITK